MNKPDMSWEHCRSFLAVLEEGSLSGAARRLALTQPTLARHIEALEQALGRALFLRSPRGLAATEAAMALRPYAESMAAAAAAMRRAASAEAGVAAGVVRISASEVIGAEVLPPILADLRQRHPRLEIELVLSNAIENLLLQAADIAVRMVEPAQEALVSRRIGAVTLGLHAHESYLARAGTPESIADLQRHSVIGFDRMTPAIRSLLARAPSFQGVDFALRSDCDLAQLASIRAGFGIGVCQAAIARRDPALKRVLATELDLKLGVWIAMHETLRETPRCRAAFDALTEGLSRHVDR